MKMFEVICIDNNGLEENFDRGIEYMAQLHQNFKVMIWVYDKLGKKREVYRERFRAVRTVVAEIEGEE